METRSIRTKPNNIDISKEYLVYVKLERIDDSDLISTEQMISQINAEQHLHNVEPSNAECKTESLDQEESCIAELKQLVAAYAREEKEPGIGGQPNASDNGDPPTQEELEEGNNSVKTEETKEEVMDFFFPAQLICTESVKKEEPEDTECVQEPGSPTTLSLVSGYTNLFDSSGSAMEGNSSTAVSSPTALFPPQTPRYWLRRRKKGGLIDCDQAKTNSPQPDATEEVEVKSENGSEVKSEIESGDDDAGTSQTLAEHTKKRKRPCPYCSKEQSHLVRHLKRRHRQEQAVADALKLSKAEQKIVFGRIRKEGIFLKNQKLMKKGLPLIRERHQTLGDELKMCEICHAFLSSKNVKVHQKRCALVTGTFGPRDMSSRPKRQCVYCGTQHTHLRRHLIRKHSEETAVMTALQLPKVEQDAVFERLRKEGIYKENLDREKRGLRLVAERLEGCSTELTKCDGCRGFFNSKQFQRHQKNCVFLTKLAGISDSLKVSDFERPTESPDAPKPFSSILKSFKNNPVGILCKRDYMIGLLGEFLWQRNTKDSVARKMRLLAKIILKMRSLLLDESIVGENILKKDNLETLLDAILSLTSGEDGARSSMVFKIQSVLGTFIRLSVKHYSQHGQRGRSYEVAEFAEQLWDRWADTFEVAFDMRRRKRGEGIYKNKKNNEAANEKISEHEAADETISEHEAANEMIPQQEATSEMIPRHEADSEMISQHEADSEMIPQHKADSEMIPQHEADSEMIRQHEADSEMMPLQETAIDTFPDPSVPDCSQTNGS
ncbi:histone-lysine N-methyltransferase setd8-a [Plakobranchus ocellatus]|uniref:Histone-lysine N-methyltransferase setd8-a n=1 Tax=Plakobranchus ocellatus TaxID=259542 RepID=A0AAV4C388_9GAST|nr:histone-lysine N-methyltransferase setd8-a [Plakobranchus ocellatus]